MCHLCALGQKPHPLHKPKLLPPFAKRHSGFLLEQPFDGPLTRASRKAKSSERSAIARILPQYFCDSKQPWIGQMRKLQGDRPYRFELMKNDGDHVRLPFHRFLQGTHRTSVENEFLEQIGDIDHAAIPWQTSCQPWFQIKGSHRHQPRHRDRVRNLGRDPYRTLWRHNPGPISRTNRHHPARGIDQLIAIMEVQAYDVAGWIVLGQSGDFRLEVARPIKNSALTFLRH